MTALHAFLTAVQLLTRVPVPGGMNHSGADRSLLRLAVVFFPLVGGLIGLLTGTVIWAAAHVWPMPLAVLLGLVIEAVLTGAFHEDAVADCCDGFGGGRSREDVLRIMKDSRIGSFGMLGLTLAVLLRVGGLASVDRAVLLPVAAASVRSAGGRGYSSWRWCLPLATARVWPGTWASESGRGTSLPGLSSRCLLSSGSPGWSRFGSGVGNWSSWLGQEPGPGMYAAGWAGRPATVWGSRATWDKCWFCWPRSPGWARRDCSGTEPLSVFPDRAALMQGVIAPGSRSVAGTGRVSCGLFRSAGPGGAARGSRVRPGGSCSGGRTHTLRP